jgi:hypothetical protein
LYQDFLKYSTSFPLPTFAKVLRGLAQHRGHVSADAEGYDGRYPPPYRTVCLSVADAAKGEQADEAIEGAEEKTEDPPYDGRSEEESEV